MKRRLLAATVALLWMLPALLAAGTLAHLAFGHDGHSVHHESSHHGHGADPAEAEAIHRSALAALAEHGHTHSPDDPAHQHSDFGLNADLAARSAAAGLQPAIAVSPVGIRELPLLSQPPLAAFGGSSAGPPKRCGPPLLARLCLLRI